MDSLTAGDLTIELAEDSSEAIRCTWRGRSNDRNPHAFLSPYFAELISAAGETSVPIEMHFQHLEHFNSSTITSLIRLIQDARAEKIRLVIVYDQALKWQRLSFDALRVFDKSDQLFELRTA